MYAGVYHGAEEVCAVGSTRAIQLSEPADAIVWHWNENVSFDVDVRDLPRGGRLCLSIWAVYGSNKKSKKKGREVSVCV